MILLAALSAFSSSPGGEFPEARRVEGELPVRLWMNNDRRYRAGDRVRLQVDADVDGFLLVLNLDPDGRLRVLFPLDPRDDTRIQAGRRYEVRGESSDAAFRAGGDGTGLIYTAVSEEPWRFDEIVLADRWDYSRLEIDRSSSDPEPDITELVQRLAGSRGFDYDVLGYRVYGESTYSTYNTYVYPGGPTYIYDDYLYCNNWNWRYDGCRRWPFDGRQRYRDSVRSRGRTQSRRSISVRRSTTSPRLWSPPRRPNPAVSQPLTQQRRWPDGASSPSCWTTRSCSRSTPSSSISPSR